jgi:predicted DNA repair protein MutK
MNEFLKLTIGFILLPVGVLVSILLPEVGIPLILISTRFLQVRYEWARKLNIWVDKKYAQFKAWLKKAFGKGSK